MELGPIYNERQTKKTYHTVLHGRYNYESVLLRV